MKDIKRAHRCNLINFRGIVGGYIYDKGYERGYDIGRDVLY